MKIVDSNMLLDGGILVYVNSDGLKFYKDNAMDSKTIGKWFKEDDINFITDENLIKEIEDAVMLYETVITDYIPAPQTITFNFSDKDTRYEIEIPQSEMEKFSVLLYTFFKDGGIECKYREIKK